MNIHDLLTQNNPIKVWLILPRIHNKRNIIKQENKNMNKKNWDV